MPSLAPLLAVALMAAPPLPQAVQEKERGERLAANGDAAGAREAFQNAVKLSPGYAAALNELGILSVNDGKLPEAVEFFQSATVSDPGFALAQNNLGFTLRKLARYSEAIAAYKAYVALETRDPAGFFGLGEAYKGAGEKANALSAYERCLAIATETDNPKFVAKAQVAAAPLHKELGVTATAPAQPAAQPQPVAQPAAQPLSQPAAQPVAPVAQPAVPPTTPQPAAQVPADRVALARLKVEEGLKARSEGRQRDALFALQDAANADPNNAQAVFELGKAYAILNYYPQAIERWQRVVSMTVDESIKAAALQNIDKARQKMGVAQSPSQPAAQPVAQSDTQPTSQPAAQPAAQPVAQPAAQPVAQPAVQPVAQPAAQPVAQPAVQPVAQPAAQPAAVPEKPLPLTPEAQQAYNSGVQLYGQQKYGDALREFEKAIAAKADFAQAFAARGSAYFAMRDYVRALNDYGQAMRLDRAMASPLFGVAESYNALGRKADALPYYRAYVSSKAPDAQANLQEISRQRMAEIGR
ncbi:MAG: tetratricopeptide repeat protein [Deltaproteobacteria bacterium]|nr:tetratricopeptide repeat protein [Deltaproteobacteria bacterium]